jgi:hypothetical protein
MRANCAQSSEGEKTMRNKQGVTEISKFFRKPGGGSACHALLFAPGHRGSVTNAPHISCRLGACMSTERRTQQQ